MGKTRQDDIYRQQRVNQRQQQLDNESRNLDLRAEELAMKQGQGNTGGYFMPTPGSLYQDARIVSPGQMFAGDAVSAGYSYAQPFQAPSYLDQEIAIPGGIEMPSIEALKLDIGEMDALQDDQIRKVLEIKSSIESDAAQLAAIGKDITDPSSVGVDVYREYKDRLNEFLRIQNRLDQMKEYTDQQVQAYIDGTQRATQSGAMYEFLGADRLGALNPAELDDMTLKQIEKAKEYSDSGNIEAGQQYLDQILGNYLVERQNRIQAFGENSDQVRNIDRNIDALRNAYRNYYKDAELALKKRAQDFEEDKYARGSRKEFQEIASLEKLIDGIYNRPDLYKDNLLGKGYAKVQYDDVNGVYRLFNEDNELVKTIDTREGDYYSIIGHLREVGKTKTPVETFMAALNNPEYDEFRYVPAEGSREEYQETLNLELSNKVTEKLYNFAEGKESNINDVLDVLNKAKVDYNGDGLADEITVEINKEIYGPNKPMLVFTSQGKDDLNPNEDKLDISKEENLNLVTDILNTIDISDIKIDNEEAVRGYNQRMVEIQNQLDSIPVDPVTGRPTKRAEKLIKELQELKDKAIQFPVVLDKRDIDRSGKTYSDDRNLQVGNKSGKFESGKTRTPVKVDYGNLKKK